MSNDEDGVRCTSMFLSEINACQPWFNCDVSSKGRTLDIPASFGPSTACDRVVKCLACGYILSTQILAWISSDELQFYYAYFTSIALLFAVIYSIASLGNSFFPPTQPETPHVQLFIKFTWIMFILAVFSQALATLIYWLLVHDWNDTVEYLDIAVHGIVFVVVSVEGFRINRIPLRWMHLWLCWALTLAYIIWSIIHGPLVLDLGNPNEEDNDPNTNDDAIYADLSWADDDIVVSDVRLQAWMITLLPFLILGVLFFCILPGFSCFVCHRLLYCYSYSFRNPSFSLNLELVVLYFPG